MRSLLTSGHGSLSLMAAPRGLLSLQRLPGEGGWLASGQDPADDGGGQGEADDGDGEVQEGHPAEGTQVVVVAGDQGEVGTGGAEHDTEQGERTAGGGDDPDQRAAKQGRQDDRHGAGDHQ